jgi:hypothetical protein
MNGYLELTLINLLAFPALLATLSYVNIPHLQTLPNVLEPLSTFKLPLILNFLTAPAPVITHVKLLLALYLHIPHFKECFFILKLIAHFWNDFFVVLFEIRVFNKVRVYRGRGRRGVLVW